MINHILLGVAVLVIALILYFAFINKEEEKTSYQREEPESPEVNQEEESFSPQSETPKTEQEEEDRI